MRKVSNIEIKELESLYKNNKIDKLEEETKKLLQFEKDNIILLNILGVVYLKKKYYNKAEQIFQNILDQNSKNSNALKNLGETYRKMNKAGYAIKYYELYLKDNPNDEEMLNNFASCCLKSKKYEVAIDSYKKLTKTKPQHEQYLTSLAFALLESLNYEEGMEILEKQLDNNINNIRAYNAYLFHQNYNPKINLNKISKYTEKFNKSYKKKKLNIIDYSYQKNKKEINLGFISPDFRKHPVGYAIKNIIKYLKSYNFNLFGYYNFTVEDDLTKKFKKEFDHFSNIVDFNEEQIINKIRSDRINILIDLAGHTTNNNLSIFYYNPAPVQISWLGYLPTTGLAQIQYKIGDPYIFSEKSKKNLSEKLINLPRIWSDFTVEERDKMSTTYSDEKSNEIIFGCFVTLKKINDDVIKLWSKVLKKFSNSKIYFKAPELHDVSIKKKLEKRFNNYEINSERLILEESSDYDSYLKSYLKVDISLDPFPWNGVTTSFESIWMGAPIFCLKGDSPYSRCSFSINKNLKMDDWIANDEDDYLIKLEKILSNKKELLLLKKNLRNHAIKNNLFNS